MATKVKPSRINITGVPQAGQVPMYVDDNEFQWGSAGSGGYGRFISLWDATTGLPISFPEATPYTYLTGDYYIVETVSSATPPVNYRPEGSTYTGTASSTAETDELEVGDVYVFDGTVWLLQSNHGKTVTFANIAGQPTDNANLAADLSAKQNELISGTNIKTVNNNSLLGSGDVSVGDMKYADFNFATKSGASITMDLSSEITPSANFTVNAPSTIKNGQQYILRVTNGATAYVMTLGTNMTNPKSVSLSLTANSTDQFVFLGVNSKLELQEAIPDVSDFVTMSTAQTISGVKTFSAEPILPSKSTSAGNNSTKPATEAQVYLKQDKLVNQSNIKSVNGTSLLGSGDLSVGDVKKESFAFESATSGATLTISDYSTIFAPSVNFTISCGDVVEGMQYIVRLNSGATAYTMTLGTGIGNPFDEDLELTANKMTTVVFLATSSSTLELFSIRTAE